MTPDQLATAVQCYAWMRAEMLKEGHIPGTEVNVTLAAARGWSAADAWRRVWWLFFFSGMKSRFAEPRARAAQAGGWFDNFAAFATANDDPLHHWYVAPMASNPRRIIAIGASAVAFCSQHEGFAAMPYRTGAKVLYRVSNLARFFVECDATARHLQMSFIDALAGGDARQAQALNHAFDRLRPFSGPITALHMLSDLGFPCHKPDRWMCRIASWCGWTPGYTPEDLFTNRRDGWRVLREACIQVAECFARGQAAPDPNPLRALDWYIANYGMRRQPRNCPCPN